MLIRNPCKKCIVRACCTMKCSDKREQLDTFELLFYDTYLVINSILSIFSWIKRNWIELCFCSFISIEVLLLIIVYRAFN